MSRTEGQDTARPASLRAKRDAYPICLPHYALHEEAVWQGEEWVREMRAGEAGLAERCDGTQTLRALMDQAPGRARAAATARYLAWWPWPVASAPPPAPARAETIVLAPHPDDAELSMGGWLAQQEHPASCLVVVCFGTLAHTINGTAFPDATAVSHVRAQEATLASRMTGVPVEVLDYPEFSIRHGLTPAALMPAREHHLGAALRRRLYALLQAHQPARVFGPAAIGTHPDHRLLFEIMLELFDEDCFPETRFDLYEEAPYAARYEAVDDFLARFDGSYLSVTPWPADITEVLPEKGALAGVFHSQFKPGIAEVVANIAARNAQRFGRTGGVEVFWELGAFAELTELM